MGTKSTHLNIKVHNGHTSSLSLLLSAEELSSVFCFTQIIIFPSVLKPLIIQKTEILFYLDGFFPSGVFHSLYSLLLLFWEMDRCGRGKTYPSSYTCCHHQWICSTVPGLGRHFQPLIVLSEFADVLGQSPLCHHVNWCTVPSWH